MQIFQEKSGIIMENIFIIVPAYNEGTVIQTALKPLLQNDYSVVVVDDGSTDNTCQKILELPVHILQHPINLGQGAALQTGVEYALEQGADIIVHFDADGQHNPDDIPALIKPIFEDAADVVLGSRFLSAASAHVVPKLKKVVLKLGMIFTGIMSGIWLTDTHNGFRAFSRSAAQKITITENRMAHASEILHQISYLKLRYIEVPVTIYYTEYSLKKGQSILNLINIILDFILGRIFK